MFKELLIRKSSLDEFKRYADMSPVEICGFITGKVYADTPANVGYAEELELIDNISDYKKEVDYVMHPQQMFNVMAKTTFINKKSDKDIVVLIHSHPTGLPIPSSIDLNRAEYDFVYVIHSPPTGISKAYTYDHQNKEFYNIPMYLQED